MSVSLPAITLVRNVTQTINLPTPANIQAIKLSNSSPFDLTISGFGVNGQEVIPTGTEQRLYADIYNAGEITVTPVNNYNVVNNGIMNLVIYFIGEQLPRGSWPVTIPTVQVALATTLKLVNDGNAAGTQIMEATVVGDSQSAVSLTNNAQLTLGDTANPATVTIVGSGGNITILATGEMDIANRVAFNLANALAGNDMVFNIPTGHNFFWQINAVTFMEYGTSGLSHNIPTGTIFDFLINAVDQMQISATGIKFMQNAMQKMLTSAGGTLLDASSGTDLTLNAPNSGGGHKLNLQVGGTTGLSTDGTSTFFKVGQIARVNMGFTAIVTTGTSITHGLGNTPTIVLATPDANTTVKATSVGATTFTLTPAANCNAFWLAIATT